MGCFAHCLGLGFEPLLKLLNTATLQEDKLLQQTIYIYSFLGYTSSRSTYYTILKYLQGVVSSHTGEK